MIAKFKEMCKVQCSSPGKLPLLGLKEQDKGTGVGILREYLYGEGHPTGAVTLVKGRSQSQQPVREVPGAINTLFPSPPAYSLFPVLPTG